MAEAPAATLPGVGPHRGLGAPEGEAGFLERAGRLRAERAWQWFAVYNPLNVWIDTPPGYEGCSDATLDAAKRWHTISLFVWSVGMADFREVLIRKGPEGEFDRPFPSVSGVPGPVPDEEQEET